ncbi:MAG TPA: hypothetical protein VNR51_09775 [Hyphomicrobium sp.]|nr:hypothetical protein [Hyphomicrobium sp.]
MTLDTSAAPAVTVTKTGSGYRVSANGKAEDFVVGDLSSSLNLPDVWHFETTGRMGWQTSGAAKMRKLGLAVNGQCPDPKTFFAAAGTPQSSVQLSPTPAAEHGSASLLPAPAPAAPQFVSESAEPDFSARARQRYGIASPPAAGCDDDPWARVKSRYVSKSEATGVDASATSTRAEPDFVLRMKERHGVKDECDNQ